MYLSHMLADNWPLPIRRLWVTVPVLAEGLANA